VEHRLVEPLARYRWSAGLLVLVRECILRFGISRFVKS
jgi:hypothetical protein